MTTKQMSRVETAKAIRAALKQAFPMTKFYVHSKSYSGGSSIDVSWTDGPTTGQVNPILKSFERCGFDGMQDLKTYLPPTEFKGELVTWGVDYVFGQRSESFEALKQAAFKVAEECDLPLLKIAGPTDSFYSSSHVEGGNYGTDWHYRDGIFSLDTRHVCLPTDSHADLIYQVARSLSFEETKPVIKPNRVTEEFINMTVEGLVA